MNVRDTSIEAYYKIKNSGRLTKLLLIHLEAFYLIGHACTARVAHNFYVANNRVEPNLNQFRSKVTMLVDQGALEELPEKVIDPVTRMRVTQYLPSGSVKEKRKKKKTDSAQARAEELIYRLQIRLNQDKYNNELCYGSDMAEEYLNYLEILKKEYKL